MNAADILAILDAHQGGSECSCGHPYFYAREHRAHVAEVIAAAVNAEPPARAALRARIPVAGD
jgi:hypothetical protein